MIDQLNPRRLGLAVALALAISGCARTPPPVTEVEGRLLLDGKPLAGARVEFVPMLDHFGAELNSSGVTDAEGHFRLTCLRQGQPGAVVARHRVVVTEAPAAAAFRGQDARAQERYAAYLRGLKNRPIPDVYGGVGRTPLEVEVKAEQREYVLRLTR